ncbi:hypothetical protein EDB81DRAFT_168033 [Dactylonectria macrodidyma]|uniref:Uncharacterized protein n=1 Tax=Dactylonectria macrodidyma TaxID=307937 RepID=A0A9P9FPP2_9HYPO|nr:hypothetical protein EDB81DRAFT_168033 [Dactylonectria macrodidyma]
MKIDHRILRAHGAHGAPQALRRASVFPRQDNGCTGWNCLTTAQQFGIIFSIVVTSVILIFAFMYYFGRITSTRTELVLARRHRSRQRRHRHSMPSIILGRLPMHQQYPNYQPRVMYQPVVYDPGRGSFLHQMAYFSPGQHPGSERPPQPIPIPPHQVQYHPGIFYPGHPLRGQLPQPPIPMACSIPPDQFQYHTQSGRPGSVPRGSIRGDSPSLRRRSSLRQPSWWQRVWRACALQPGRASTIETSPAPRTPVRSRSGSTVAHDTRRPTTARTRSREAQGSRRSRRSRSRSVGPTPSPRTCHARTPHQSDDHMAESPRTDLATVHSDDFQLPPPDMLRGGSIDSTLPGQHSGTVIEEGVARSMSSGCDYLPSNSSFRSG